jgi:hypothetical protein
MSEPTQLEKLLREEQLIVSHIQELKQDLQRDIDVYEGDLSVLRTQMTDLKNGKNDNAWITYLDITNPDREEDDQ